MELAGVAAAGEVGLRQQGQDWRLSVPDELRRADVAIGNDAIVDVRSGSGGSIAITARNFTGTGLGTRVRAGIAAGLGTVEAQAGDIDINATEAINLDEMWIVNEVREGGTGNAGNLNISTGTLSLTNVLVSADTFGQGNAGNITITARDAVSSDGIFSSASSSVGSGAIGQGGNISITTGTLSFTNDARVDTGTSSRLDNGTFGRGNAGNVTITARDAVSFDGFFGGAFSSVGPEAIGQGGNISITTGTLSLTNSAGVNADTFGQGNAGNITITARDAVSFDGLFGGAFSSVGLGGIGQGGNVSITTSTLSLTNGGRVGADTFGQGNAGSVTITAKDAVSFDGASRSGFPSGVFSGVASGSIGQGGNVSITTGRLSLTRGAVVDASTFGQGNAGSVTITVRDAVSFDGVGKNGASGAYSSVEPEAIGQGGTIAINTDRFSITNRAQLSASSQGRGAAGDIEVTARQLRLDSRGSIQAQTRSGRGGNITLQVSDFLLLRRGSFISTTAGTAQAGGNGGNITLNGGFIVAVPQENSNISANAFSGRGGNINITTQGVFGIAPRSSAIPGLNSITASSQTGVSGTITLNTPDVDPSRGTAILPGSVIDTNALIASSCVARRSRQGRFVITGTGGLAPQPDDLANSAFPTYELVPQPPAASTSPSVPEADRIYQTDTGEIVLGRSCES